jgi:hypothetical protein
MGHTVEHSKATTTSSKCDATCGRNDGAKRVRADQSDFLFLERPIREVETRSRRRI